MNLRADFLLDSEKRYQGAIGSRFLWVVCSMTALVVLLLIAGFQTVNVHLARRDIETTTKTLEVLNPQIESLLWARKESALCKRYFNELTSWRSSRSSVQQVLLRLQRDLPETIQLLQLNLRDELAMPVREEGSEKKEPRRQCRISLSGRVKGSEAEQTMARFIQKLNEPAEGSAPFFQTVTLLKIQAESAGDNGESRFEIEAVQQERILK